MCQQHLSCKWCTKWAFFFVSGCRFGVSSIDCVIDCFIDPDYPNPNSIYTTCDRWVIQILLPPPFFSLNHSGEKSNPFADVHSEIDVGQQILTQNSNPSMSKVHAHHYTLCGFSRTLEFSFCRFFCKTWKNSKRQDSLKRVYVRGMK